MMHGIDISDWQRGINLAAVAGDFVIIKATGGTRYVSPSWRRQAEDALAAGKLLGFYHYAMEYGEYHSPWEEARHFLDTIADFRGKCILALDFEADAQGLPVTWPRQFMDIVEQEWGIRPLFYAYASYLNSRDHGELTKYQLWMASYLERYAGQGYQDNPEQIWPISNWEYLTMYQYTSKGRIPGYDGNLDTNVFYGDEEDWRLLSGDGKKEEYMGRIQTMIDHAIAIADDDSHGYSQDMHQRWDPDRDCSTLMYDSAYAAGYDVNGIGPDKVKYTGTMVTDFTHAGFTVHNYGAIDPFPGCIFLRDPYGAGGHTEMYIGDGKTVGAHASEHGTAYGEPGDQTGNEISIAPDYGNWDFVLVPPTDEVPKAWELLGWTQHGGDNQRFFIERQPNSDLVAIRCKADGRYLDVTEGKAEPGTIVQLYSERHGGKNQLWKIDRDDRGYCRIVSALDDKLVLDIVESNPNNGAKVCIYTRRVENSANQEWLLLDNYDGTFTIMNNGFLTKLVLDCAGGGK